MNKKIISYLSAAVLMCSSLLASCSDKEDVTGFVDGRSLTIAAKLDGSAGAATRADDVTNDRAAYDQWSYRGFSIGNVMGFYSEHGNFLDNNGEGPFVNMFLECTGGDSPYYFEGKEQISPTSMSATKVFLYFPYSAVMESNASGMELRRTKQGETAPLRCVDFLVGAGIDASNLHDGLLTGTFLHSFSELIIMRGKGFDNPKPGKETITVVMKQPYSHVKIDYVASPWSCTPRLVYDENYATEKGIDCRRWEAWQGTNYGITEEDPVGRQAWFALLPTIGTGDERSSVDYIEIYDNEGNLQKVSALKLAKNENGSFTKMLDGSWRYPMEITMDELVPTVNPFRIIPWEGDTDITDARERGIHNETEFSLWQQHYAAHLIGGDREQDLLNYGDLIIDAATGEKTWHFYLLNDMDFSNYEYGSESNAVIPEFHDILDGVSTTLENHRFINHTLSNLKKPLIDILDGGTVMNIDFIEPYINLSDGSASSDVAANPVGTLANTMKSGTIDNCTIDNGTIVSMGPVGMVAGSVADGTITGCSFSGFMIGTESNAESKYMFGKEEPSGEVKIEDTTANVVFN